MKTATEILKSELDKAEEIITMQWSIISRQADELARLRSSDIQVPKHPSAQPECAAREDVVTCRAPTARGLIKFTQSLRD